MIRAGNVGVEVFSERLPTVLGVACSKRLLEITSRNIEKSYRKRQLWTCFRLVWLDDCRTSDVTWASHYEPRVPNSDYRYTVGLESYQARTSVSSWWGGTKGLDKCNRMQDVRVPWCTSTWALADCRARISGKRGHWVRNTPLCRSIPMPKQPAIRRRH